MAQTIFSQSPSFFDPANQANKAALLPSQVNPYTPQVAGLDSGTGLVLSHTYTPSRLDHFPEDSYDLRPTSHLMRFLHALMGDAGAGQLRKRYTVQQFQRALSSTHFFDLDGFYGALFGAVRTPFEQIPISPMASVATPDEWDQYTSADATYRERIFALAKAISMGATIPGLQAAAEAVLGTPCTIYETWALLDANGAPGNSRTYANVQSSYATWGATLGQSWADVTGAVTLGRTNGLNRSEIVIHPVRNYQDSSTLPVGETLQPAEVQQAQDEYNVMRVLRRLKPAGSLISVDLNISTIHVPVAISQVVTDSVYWEIVGVITPRPYLVGADEIYPLSYGQQQAGVQATDSRIVPKPAFSRYQGEEWSYNNDIVTALSYTEQQAGTVDQTTSFEVMRGTDGQMVWYTPDRGVRDTSHVVTARAAHSGVTVAAPYAGERVPVMTSG